jgi:flagellar hook assembly protein FlgD
LTLLARVAFALLVAATFGAFFVAQRLKAEPSVINNFQVVKYFSPNADGYKDVQVVRFRLKNTDDVTVDVLDADGGRVARLVSGRRAQPFQPVRLTWRGKTDDGLGAPDGTYRVRIGLRREGRSVIAPYSFTLDTTPPRPAVIATTQDIVAPGQPVGLTIRGAGPRARPQFTVLRTDEGEPKVIRKFFGTRGERHATWDGKDAAGRPAAPGTYLIAVSARDRSYNLGTGPELPPRPGAIDGRPGVTVRGLAVQPPVKAVPAGQLTSFRVDARGQSYRWSVRRIGESRPRKHSEGRKTTSIVTPLAPRGISGVYLLEVRAGRYSAQVPFAVQSETPAPLLVVLPVMAWLGANQLDDPRRPDGLPNTLANRSPVPFPRLFAGEDGLPAGFADEVAPLLVALDRARVRYDITTDIALSLGGGPDAKTRPGVLFAGSPRWVTRPVAKRLRKYVDEGGRVALFGTGSLRASVQVGATRLLRPTPPGPSDAFGGRIADPRPLEGDPAPVLAPFDEDPPDLPVFAGTDAFLAGVARVEELISPGEGAEVVAAIGQQTTAEEITQAEAEGRDPREQRPAFSMVKQGKGIVFRVGVEGWVQRLAKGDPKIVQLTRNVVDLLRRVNPRPRSVG